MTRPRRMTDAERVEVRRVIDRLAEHPDALNCRPGIRGACRRPGCAEHQPSTDREEASPQDSG